MDVVGRGVSPRLDLRRPSPPEGLGPLLELRRLHHGLDLSPVTDLQRHSRDINDAMLQVRKCLDHN